MATSVTYKRFNGTTWEELYFPYSHSHSWGSITSKPSWIGSSKPTYTASEITTTAGITVQASLNNFASTASLKSETISALSISGKTITYTKADGTKGTLTTQDTNTTYSAATTSANGLMSSSDKAKLDGITIDSSATFSSTTANNIPTKQAVASYLSSNYLSVGDVSFSQTLTSGTAIGTITINGTAKTIYAPSSSGGSSSGGGLTEGGQLDVATIEDFYSKYINDLSGNYVTTAKVVECVKAYNNGDLGGGSSSGGGYEDSPTFSTVTCDNLTVSTSGGASIHRIYVGGSGSFAGSCNFTGGIYINGTHIDTYIRNLVG